MEKGTFEMSLEGRLGPQNGRWKGIVGEGKWAAARNRGM